MGIHSPKEEGREEGRDLTGKEKRIGLSASTEKNQNRNIIVGWDRVNQAWEGRAEECVLLVAYICLVHPSRCQQTALKPTGKVCVCVSYAHTHTHTNMQREILSDIQGNGQTLVEVFL